MPRLISMGRVLPLSVVVLALLPDLALANPVVRIAAQAVVSRATTVAATFAVAHTLVGTGGPLAGGCFDADFSILGVSNSSCKNSDFFPHATPPGNDSADANASAISALLGGGGVNTKPTALSKGDFAAAGAFARTASDLSIDVGLPAGAPAATVTVTLPNGDTFTAKKDPEMTFYGYVLSDIGEGELDLRLMAHEVMGLSFEDYLPPSAQATLVTPDNVYFALLLAIDGEAGTISVSNFGSLVTNPLSDADFESVSTSDEVGFRLRGDREYTFDIPTQGGVGTVQSIAYDEVEMRVAVPEPPGLALVAVALLAAGLCGVRRTVQRLDKPPAGV